MSNEHCLWYYYTFQAVFKVTQASIIFLEYCEYNINAWTGSINRVICRKFFNFE